MLYREVMEEREKEMLSSFAAKSAESKGRKEEEEKCILRTEFQRDKDRIIHSKAFRRLMYKTQVFLPMEEDHYRTRMTHTLEVSQIARTIARGLRLNEDLTEAIALGHDLGHTPFGHMGENALNLCHPGGFEHNKQSLRIVDVLENSHNRRGMNLTDEVRDGILNHTGPKDPYTLEGQIVKTSDRIAYINHDIDDACRNGILKIENLPKESLDFLGHSHSQRISALVIDMIKESEGKEKISLSEEALHHMLSLRKYMFENVYLNKKVNRGQIIEGEEKIVEYLYNYYLEHSNEISNDMQYLIPEYGERETAKDYVAMMTDRYAIKTYESLIQKI